MASLSFWETPSQSGAARDGLVTPLPKVGQPVRPEKAFNMLFVPDLVLLKIDSLRLLLSFCVKVAGRYRGNECIHTSVADNDEPPFPPADGTAWNEPERDGHAPFPASSFGGLNAFP